ncbi:5'-methylthioadenosine/S-adenosylhomocysteine nucleosidase [Notoacmeibacter ruber]|uniref:5'-methylthioadenosine/S-adenosylhomocysteine nucleosidase n=1 Tax=Notoacmeibacter ruber TaxID=2670375 RepID=A0A3L7J9H7_9HYPH|nr:5'-methylthioadenosine/S-adenosylhomocysteine nucleosidase [Notoacmeibacter ruber]RLQ87398.1 5'-methylthioadenosine/S-adenosylhomocysteine nucleosidase [Notoacmeibacter ruber]
MADPSALLKDVAGKRVLYVMATEQEYGDELRSLFTPLRTGVGPVEAALGLAVGLARLAHSFQLPDLIVSIGSAGSQRLEQGEVYQVSSVAYRDMDASALGFPKGETPFLDLPPIMPLPFSVADIPSATLSTGANIVSGADYDGIDADLVDMETFAHLRAAMQFDVPLVGLRGVSDGAEELRHFDDWTRLLPILDMKLASAVNGVEKSIRDGMLA